MKKYKTDWYLYYLINVTLIILVSFPIYWAFVSSIKQPDELITNTQHSFLKIQHLKVMKEFGI